MTTENDFVLISQKEFADGSTNPTSRNRHRVTKCWFCKQDRKKCVWPDHQEKCERCTQLDYTCTINAPPEDAETNRRVLSKYKCSFCRDARQKCLPVDRHWPQRCDRCVAKSLECSAPLNSLNVRLKSPPGTPVVQTSPSYISQPLESGHDSSAIIHKRPFRCEVPGCVNLQGFFIQNDLERHQKSMHEGGLNTKPKTYQCMGKNCKIPTKIWPRLDNFKNHLKMMHQGEDVEALIKSSQIDPLSSLPSHHYSSNNGAGDSFKQLDLQTLGTEIDQFNGENDSTFRASDLPFHIDSSRTTMGGPKTKAKQIVDEWKSPTCNKRSHLDTLPSEVSASIYNPENAVYESPGLRNTSIEPNARTNERIRLQHKRLRQESHLYKPLGRNEFRVIALLPSSVSETKIECEMQNWKGEPFEALSYVWNYESGDEDIYIKPSPTDGQSGTSITSMRDVVEMARLNQVQTVPVRRNLVDILMKLRLREQKRLLWVDAICINMSDMEERSQQISVIPTVFSQASNVCICLSDPDGENSPALRVLPSLLQLDGQERDWHHGNYQNVRSMKSLLTNRFFSRRWIVQEIALAKHATVHCGYDVVRFDDFVDAIGILQFLEQQKMEPSDSYSTHRAHDLDAELGEIETFPAVIIINLVRNMFRRTDNGSINLKLLSLESLVCRLTFSKCTDPRDVIYSLLGLANDVHIPRVSKGFPYRSHAMHAIPLSTDIKPPSNGHNVDLTALQKTKIAGAVQKFLRLLSPKYQTVFTVDYTKPALDVYKEFVFRTIARTGNLDILLRPWAPDVVSLPSWIPNWHAGPFQNNDMGEAVRVNADSLVGQPGQPIYRAAGWTSGSCQLLSDIDQYALQVRGTIWGSILRTRTEAMGGNIPLKWFQLAGWDNEKVEPPEEFWRTLVGNRGPQNQTFPGIIYRRALLQLRQRMPRGMALNLERIARETPSSIIKAFAERLLQVVWNRKLIRDSRECLGLAPESAEVGDKIAILYGCSVPVCIRETGSTKGLITYEVVGECYIHGIMDGEALGGEHKLEEQELVLI